MEYLMTYGWAILIIAVVLGALFQLGVFNSSSFSPRAPPGACQVFRPSGPGTVTNINLMGVCTGQLPQYVGVFNGASGYVDSGNGAGLNMINEITLAAWAKPNGGQYVSSYAIAKGVYNTEAYAMDFWNSGPNPYGFSMVFTTSVNGRVYPYIANAWTPNQWQFFVITYTSGHLGFYRNGILLQDNTGYTGTISTTTSNLLLGRVFGQNYYFNGTISNVQIYNASLSANQVQALYLEGMGGAPMKLQNLMGWWPLNGNSNDYSGNNNNGVPTAVTFTSQYGK